MSRKNKFNLNISRDHPKYSAYKELASFVYRDLQAACIMRGMDFDELVEGDQGSLSSWFIRNYDQPMDRELLEDFDLWMDKQLKKRGYKKKDPVRQFKRFSNTDEDNNITVKTKSLRKTRIPKKKREKKSKNKFGIYEGTKKSLTYDLTSDLYDKLRHKYEVKELYKNFAPKMYLEVKKVFPDALEKSVKMWMKRAIDELEKKENKT